MMFFLGILYLLCAIFPFMAVMLGLPDIYSNPMQRILQFGSGMILAGIMRKSQLGDRSGHAASFKIIAAGSVLLLVVFISRMSQMMYKNNYLLYSWVTFPLLLILIWSSITAEKNTTRTLCGGGGGRLGDLSYPIYLAQFFVWSPVKKIAATYPDIFETQWDIKGTALAVMLCALLTVLFVYLFDRPIKMIITSVLRDRVKNPLECGMHDEEKTIL